MGRSRYGSSIYYFAYLLSQPGNWEDKMIDALQLDIIKLLTNTMWPIYTKEHADYTKFLTKRVFGLPDDVPEKFVLLFYPTATGLEKKTMPNSTTTTGTLNIISGLMVVVREVVKLQCANRGVSPSSFLIKDRYENDLDLDIPIAAIPGRIIILARSINSSLTVTNYE